jgi:hypothetical protein
LALDIYVGSLARYYTQEWENVVQAYARESGQSYQKIGPGVDQPLPNWDEVANVSKQWLEVINQQLSSHLDGPITWSEEPTSPYFTDRPGYDGWGAIVTAASYVNAGKPIPEMLSEDWMADPVVLEAMETKESGKNRFIMITCSGLWLPADFDFTFDFVDVCNEKINISSTGLLAIGLRMLNEQTVEMDAGEMNSALQAQLTAESPLEDVFRFSLSMYTDLARKAHENKLPMFYDM